MKPRNFPDRVTRRRLRAFLRQGREVELDRETLARIETTDIKFRRVHGRGTRPMVFR